MARTKSTTPTSPKETDMAKNETPEVEAPKTYTPGDVAKLVDRDPKQVRAFLRKEFTRPGEAKNTSWHLTEEVKDLVVTHYAKLDEPETEDDTDEA